MKYVFDIDGTICSVEQDYKNAKPINENIRIVNQLYKEGHTIWFYTARGSETKINWNRRTKKQLNIWGIRYHRVVFKKPSADLYIDDKAINAQEFFNNYGKG